MPPRGDFILPETVVLAGLRFRRRAAPFWAPRDSPGAWAGLTRSCLLGGAGADRGLGGRLGSLARDCMARRLLLRSLLGGVPGAGADGDT